MLQWLQKRQEADPFEGNQFARSRYLAEDSKGTLKNVSLVARLAAFLVPLFLLLDYFAYPEFFYQFLYLRLGCTGAIIAIWFCCHLPWARRNYRILAVSIPLLCAISISVMIYYTKDPGTPYYAGLLLCIMAVGALCHWAYREAIFTSIAVAVLYAIATSPGLSADLAAKDLSYFINNCLFILSTGLIIIVGSCANHGNRLLEFLTRSKLKKQTVALEEKNQELKQTLQTLQETETQLIQSEKMSFIGQVSAGVIHEIGNPLNFSNQALFLLRKRLKRAGVEDEFGETIEDIQEGMDRIKAIVTEMRDFTHISGSGGENFVISEPVESAIRILTPELEKEKVEICRDFKSEERVSGSENKITQVATNLIHNAIQALKTLNKSGRIIVSSESVHGKGALFSVTDNGPGIPEELKSKLFDPFFTTKDPGEGTGLGLSICYRIIESHGGAIDVQTPAEGGTCFSVFLPSQSLQTVPTS